MWCVVYGDSNATLFVVVFERTFGLDPVRQECEGRVNIGEVK